MTEADCVAPAMWTPATVGGRHRTLKAKTLRRLLKKKGLKTTGKKSTLMKRLKMKGGNYGGDPKSMGGSLVGAPFTVGGETTKGGRRRTRRSRKFMGMY